MWSFGLHGRAQARRPPDSACPAPFACQKSSPSTGLAGFSCAKSPLPAIVIVPSKTAKSSLVEPDYRRQTRPIGPIWAGTRRRLYPRAAWGNLCSPAVPRVSVIIPTYNRKDRLAIVLGGLDRQTAPPEAFEVVIVDDGSSDGTTEWISAQRRRYAIRGIRQANGGPARARNAAIAAAEGSLLLFIDDDIEPTPPLVAEHLASHDAEAKIVVTGPMASLPHYRQPWVAWEQAKIEAQYAAMERGDWHPTYRQFWTGNASIARQAVLDAGGFDPNYLRAEDIELGRRLHARGFRFRFNPRARGLHHAERTLESWENVHRSYGRLEVDILAQAGEEDVTDVLAGNWLRVHRLTRALVERCAGNPKSTAAVGAALKALIRTEMVTSAPLGAGRACSVLANLHYWQACFDALGKARTAEVFRRAGELGASP